MATPKSEEEISFINVHEKDNVWKVISNTCGGGSATQHTLVMLNCEALMGRREGGGGSADGMVLGAFGRLSSKTVVEKLLSIASDNDVNIVSTNFNTCKKKRSHKLSEKGKKRTDYILAQQSDSR